MEPAVTPMPLPPDEPATHRCRNDEAVAANLEGGHIGELRDLVTAIRRGSHPDISIYLAACTRAGAFDEVLEEGMKGIEVGDLNGDGIDEILVVHTDAGSRSYGVYEFASGRLRPVRDENGQAVEILAGGTFGPDGEQGNWACTRDAEAGRQLIVQVTMRPTNVGDPYKWPWAWTRESFALTRATLYKVSLVTGRGMREYAKTSGYGWPPSAWTTSMGTCPTRDEWGYDGY